MNSRERTFLALDFEQPDRVPIDFWMSKGFKRKLESALGVSEDNTVQYHGRVLQLSPNADRPSYAGARVEVQEHLDGSLLVSYQGKSCRSCHNLGHQNGLPGHPGSPGLCPK